MGEGSADNIGRVVEMIRRAGRVVVFTGAGVSTESGIPDFRSPGGIWTRFDPEDFTIERFLASAETRRRQWQFLLLGGLLRDARPNAAHEAIAELEKIGRLECVITQNIDDLHQKAGNDSSRVYELHGSLKWLRCLKCRRRFPLARLVEEFRDSADPPDCPSCRGILKPDVVFFGEPLPEETLSLAMRQARECDLFIVVGSSLVVYPAAYLPLIAKEAGAALVIVNLTETPADGIADVVIRAKAGETMGRIISRLKEGI